MALTQPILYSVPAFDATQPYTFTFNVVGGNQVTANTLTIKNNSTLAVVYSETQTSFRFAHVLPANVLTNGTYYQATLTTQDAQGDTSPVSNTVQFYCYATPSFAFNNMPVNNIVTNSSYAFSVAYSQAQGESLNAYVYNLYSVSGALIATSGTIYTTNMGDTVVSYLFSGFDDLTDYYIECTGVTANGMNVTTGRVRFSVNYRQPSLFSSFIVENNCSGGYITLQSNVVGIMGESFPSPPTYIDNAAVDLTTEGSYVQWVEGYSWDGDWTARLWGRDFTPNTEIWQLSNANGETLVVRYCTDNTTCWIELRVQNTTWPHGYITASQPITLPTAGDELFVWIRKVNNLYDVILENRGVSA